MKYIRLAMFAGVAAIIAILVGLVFIERRKADAALANSARLSEQVEGLLKTNADQGAAIARLTNQRVIDERFAALFAGTLSQIQQEAMAANQALADLKETDPDARAFLATPIPDSVRGLLNNPRSNPRP